VSQLGTTDERVAALVAHGLTNEEIAERLTLRPKTVEWHLTRIYRKLGVRSRTELALKIQGSERDDHSGPRAASRKTATVRPADQSSTASNESRREP
jgi:DNA-binding CsgD family transcriptional regulator